MTGTGNGSLVADGDFGGTGAVFVVDFAAGLAGAGLLTTGMDAAETALKSGNVVSEPSAGRIGGFNFKLDAGFK